jgi:hypothetical protein
MILIGKEGDEEIKKVFKSKPVKKPQISPQNDDNFFGYFERFLDQQIMIIKKKIAQPLQQPRRQRFYSEDT